MNVVPLNTIGGLPTRNLQSGHFEMAEAISGEKLAEDYLGRRVACAHCPVACIHLAALRLPYPDDPYFYKTLMLAYDHEPIFAMGSLLGIGEVPGLLQLMDEAENSGAGCYERRRCSGLGHRSPAEKARQHRRNPGAGT